MNFFNIKPICIASIAVLLNACATHAPPPVPSSEYNSKAMAQQFRNTGQTIHPHTAKAPPKVRANVKGKVLYVLPTPAQEGDPNLQDQDSEVSSNRYSYPVYDGNDDNPYVYTPPTPTNYPADNDADYYYYPLYFGD